ncbi:hypothetical protein DO021_20475 [Desulfobacter hydrogenophilus]|uniref:Uncharacterized protein n=1 Tax=Desulfobacter hydrogenophilus TaxID=2291 RepID=A0A328F9U2_9BACT|nr:hypothetical protein [Desulfobacter hydrogenophilus]NDY74249.1 hypothetical protein [Desulfobacter hydrogenophilus]QBH14575.1 hypothetical protein EYB58_17570 [Desulfobacter hydrogenophilus]RAM00172.1 hypothetical protein DO021_20475 [Desulfobacter hydrogenophilus]
MVRPKKTTQTSEKEESKSMIQEEETESAKTASAEKTGETEPVIRILYHGECPKLTPRGMGNIKYELGINDENDEAYIRIAGNASSGAFNTKWVGVNEIRERLEKLAEETFRAIILQELYKSQSSNNHGFLGAILKAEGVLVGVEKPPSMLQMGEWTGLLKKIESLKREGVSLTDHIAVAAKERAEKRAEDLLKRKSVKTDK